MLDSTEWKICVMARWGYYAKTICKYVKKYDGTSYKPGTIYRVCQKNGIQISAYRRAETKESQAQIRELLGPVRRRTKKVVQKKRAAA